MRTTDCLRQAAELLEVRGWCRYATTSKGRIDAMAAVNQACHGLGEFTTECDGTCFRAHSRLREYVGQESLTLWNDSNTNLMDITTAMRMAAQRKVSTADHAPLHFPPVPQGTPQRAQAQG